MENKKNKNLLVTICVIIGVIVVIGIYILFYVRQELGVSSSKKHELDDLVYVIPENFIKTSKSDSKSLHKYEHYDYSNKLVDASCQIRIEDNKPIYYYKYMLSDGSITREDAEKDFKPLDEYIRVFSHLPKQVENFNSSILKKENINNSKWYTYHLATEFDNVYYLFHYDGADDYAKNYNIELILNYDNSDDKVCEKAYNELKNSLKIK